MSLDKLKEELDDLCGTSYTVLRRYLDSHLDYDEITKVTMIKAAIGYVKSNHFLGVREISIPFIAEDGSILRVRYNIRDDLVIDVAKLG